MDDSGYANYQDSRLQPPDEGDEPQGAFECWMRCKHGDACAALFARVTHDEMADADVWASKMGCEDCDEWED